MKTLAEVISSNKEIFGPGEGEQVLRQAVLKLPEDQQKVLALHFNQQISIKEISLEMQCSITTTYSKLNKALFTLKNEFNPSAFARMYSILYPGTGKPTF